MANLRGGEAECILKCIWIVQGEGLDWKQELCRYVAILTTASDHNTTGKSSAKLLFNRKIRGKLSDCTMPQNNQEIRIMTLNEKVEQSFVPITAAGQNIDSWRWEIKKR